MNLSALLQKNIVAHANGYAGKGARFVGLAKAEWNEADHPRDEDGRFEEGGMATPLSGREDYAVSNYAQNGYNYINSTLRSGDDSKFSSSTKEQVQLLDNVIARSALAEDTTVYRVVEGKRAGDKYLKEGAVISDKAFMSTSSNENSALRAVADTGARMSTVTVLEITAPKNTPAFDLAGRSTTPSMIAPRGSEHELLFARNTSLRIDKVIVQPNGERRVQATIIDLLQKNTDASAHQAATSPHNLLPLPTKAQRSAGNYPKGAICISGLNISIENPAGSVRDVSHPAMTAHYGYVRGTTGADGDHLDVFVKPGTPDDWDGLIYVIDQADEIGKFDEAKVMLGYSSEAEARRAYLNHHTGTWTARIIQITPMTLDKFKEWMTGDLSAPVGKVSRETLGRILRKAKSRAKGSPRTLIAAHEKRVTAAITKYLSAQAKRMIPLLVAAYKQPAKKRLLQTMLRKADPTPDEIVDKVKLEGWETLVNTDITPAIEAALIVAGLYAAVEAVKAYTAAAAAVAAPVATMEVITGLVNERAVLYAQQAAAELVVNITDATRNMLRDKIAQAVREGWTSDQLQIELASSRAFSAARAMNIASYELGSALQAGNLIGWKASGVVTGKRWITADDILVDEDKCRANEAQGVIPLDEAFQSGDDAPLAHPNCRCSMVPITSD